MKFAIREKLSGKDIKQLRKKLNLTQNEFANFCCVSNKTIERWEKSEQVYGTINTIYEMLNNNNNLIEEFLRKENVKVFEIFEKNDILKRLIKYLKEEHSIKYTDIMKKFDITKGVMERLK